MNKLSTTGRVYIGMTDEELPREGRPGEYIQVYKLYDEQALNEYRLWRTLEDSGDWSDNEMRDHNIRPL